MSTPCCVCATVITLWRRDASCGKAVRGRSPPIGFCATATFRSDFRRAGVRAMKAMTAGVTKAGKGINNLSWNILGQTYIPKALSETSFSWHALLPPGTFVPPHIHVNQDEFIYVLEGRFDLILDGKPATASAGEFIRLPMKIMHGLFNKSDQPIKCLFWVSPTGKLFDLFKKIDKVPDPAEVTRLAALHDVNFLPPPPALACFSESARSVPRRRARLKGGACAPVCSCSPAPCQSRPAARSP